MLVTQRPGSNALATAKRISDTMVRLKAGFPSGLDYNIGYNPTEFIAQSVSELIKTIYEAMILVVIVVLVFLQGWRPAIIPIVAIPVSLVGTFAAMAALGFAINNLTLFGLVLAVGIVVDDAIVVVENVERHLRDGMSRRDAALKTMEEVGGALVSIALVLCAVFVPTAFLGGISGQFFQQFAITIAVATAISCFCSLTLSPALASLILQPHAEKRPPASWNLIGRGWETFSGCFQPRLRPAVPFLCRRRRLRDPAFGGDAAGLSGADRQRRLAARHHAARLHSGAGPRLCDRFGATAGRGLAGAHHRDRPADREDRARHARHRPRRGVRRAVRRDPHPGQQCRGAVPGVRGARSAPEEGSDRGFDHRRIAQAAGQHRGRVHHRDSAAGGSRHRHRRRLRHAHSGPPGPRARTAGRGHRRAGCGGAQGARPDVGVLAVHRQYPAGVRRHRPHQGAEARRSDPEHHRRDRDLFRLGLCQRLQYSRPHLSRHRAGGPAVPQGDRRSRPPAHPQCRRRHGAARQRRGFPRHRRDRIVSRATTSIRRPNCRATPRPERVRQPPSTP